MNESQEEHKAIELSEEPTSSHLAETPSANAEKVKPPLTMEEKKKVWIRRIIGAIVFFSVLGSLALLAAAQAVTFLFKTILSP
ncbi:MAG: hypothetical protein K2Y39_09950 [Candidatus Obscuribacterales bacterium]|nr:hypothetical protein [Candidatus Obscuribacterales bacterium]